MTEQQVRDEANAEIAAIRESAGSLLGAWETRVQLGNLGRALSQVGAYLSGVVAAETRRVDSYLARNAANQAVTVPLRRS